MPRRSILSGAERDSFLALPDNQEEFIRHYTFSESDLSLIRQRRGDANRMGVAVQLCLLRFPGQGLLPDATVPMPLLQWIGRQLRLDPICWPQYAEREETRREHLLELRAYLGMDPFGLRHYRQSVHATTELALQTDKGTVLASSVLDSLRQRFGQGCIDAPVGAGDGLGADALDDTRGRKEYVLAAQTVNQGRGQHDALVSLPCQFIKAVHAGAVMPRCERLEAKDGLQFQ